MKLGQNQLYFLLCTLLFFFLIFTFALHFLQDFTLLFILKNFYGSICHQIESRCFFVNAKPMLICARCTGIFGGAFILFLILSLNKTLRKSLDKFSFKSILVFALPLIIEWSLNFIFKIETTNFVRFLTGIIFSIIPVYFMNSLLIYHKID